MQNWPIDLKEGTKLFEVACLLSHGLSCKDIAARLNLAHGTTKFYINQIYKKCGVNDRLQVYMVLNDQIKEEETLP